ncbi:MAG: ribosome small subunit-dependent GTPase A [Burkholderiales bacterium]
MTIEFDFDVLSSLGLTPALASRALQLDVEGDAKLVRVTEVHRETLTIHDGWESSTARPLPRFARAMIEADTGVAVGDWVLISPDAHGGTWVADRVPPSTHIARRDGEGRRHPVVSNVDTALLVMGLDDDFNPRRLERYFALVHDEGVTAAVVLTKRDVAAPSDDLVEERLAALEGRVPAGTDVHAVDGTDPETAATLAGYLRRGQTLVLLGSSGAGKSTLTNTLLGSAVQSTGAVREHDSRGKHTTTSRSLHRLPGGACVIDTPGLRALRPDGDTESLAGAFADVAALAAQCRFRDCRHEQEPGCAVRAGVSADHLRNYQKLLREIQRDNMTALDRQRQVAMWKARGRAAAERMRAKRGSSG